MKKKRHFFKFLPKNFTTIETKNVMLQLLLIVIRIKIGIWIKIELEYLKFQIFYITFSTNLVNLHVEVT